MAQACIVIADQGFTSIASFLVGVLIARSCTRAEYGVFVMGLSLIRFIIGIQESLVSVPYTVQYPRYGKEGRNACLGSNVVLQLSICFVVLIGFVVGSRVTSALGENVALARIVFALCAASLALMIREFLRFVLLAELRVWTCLAMGLAANVLTIGALSWTQHNCTLSASGAFLIITCCSGIPAVIVSLLYWRQPRFMANQIRRDCVSNWDLGKWLLARTLAYVVAVSTYPFALAAFDGTTQVGVYGACLQLALLLNPLFMGLSSYLRPRTARVATDNPRRLRSMVFTMVAGLSLPIVMLVTAALIWGDWAMVHLYGPGYGGTRWILVTCVLATGMYVLGAPFSIAFEAVRRTDLTFIGRFVGAVATLTVGVAGTRMLGPQGAAVGLLCSHAVCNVYWVSKLQALEQSAPDTEPVFVQVIG